MSEPPVDIEPESVCENCGAPANVHISDVTRGVAKIRNLCAGCVDEIERHRINYRRRTGDAVTLIVFGLIVLVLSVLADFLPLGGEEGFGWRQRQGVVIGGILVLLGAIVRARAILLIGIMMTVLSMLADWLAFGRAEGFGSQQMLGSAMGVAVVALGLWLARRRNRRSSNT
ncbi:MAG: LPXTG cell wall anchor domain-containing protein [Phycisphaerae bacterium]